MEKLDEIKTHWQSWASTFGDDLRATTRSSNIKKLEIKALISMIKKFTKKPLDKLRILEVGCGNGFNSISIAQEFGCEVDAFDFIPDMVESANSNLNRIGGDLVNKVNFQVGDVLNLDIEQSYDVVFSCRCLINLPDSGMQNKSILELARLVKTDGVLLLLENFVESHSAQNDLRELVDLPRRKVAEFNHFFDYKGFSNFVKENGLEIVGNSNFSSLHDIMQYVVVPMLNNGETDYEHDVMKSITRLMLNFEEEQEESFGDFGQNKLIAIKHE